MAKLVLAASGLLLVPALYGGLAEKALVSSASAIEEARQPDELTEQTVSRALEQDESLAAADIDVQVIDGAVRLSGNVPTERERVAALLLATSARGTRVLVDDLRVASRE